jgi:hypothetical protein
MDMLLITNDPNSGNPNAAYKCIKCDELHRYVKVEPSDVCAYEGRERPEHEDARQLSKEEAMDMLLITNDPNSGNPNAAYKCIKCDELHRYVKVKPSDVCAYEGRERPEHEDARELSKEESLAMQALDVGLNIYGYRGGEQLVSPPDGLCLFHSLAMGLGIEGLSGPQVRAELMTWLRDEKHSGYKFKGRDVHHTLLWIKPRGLVVGTQPLAAIACPRRLMTPRPPRVNATQLMLIVCLFNHHVITRVARLCCAPLGPDCFACL